MLLAAIITRGVLLAGLAQALLRSFINPILDFANGRQAVRNEESWAVGSLVHIKGLDGKYHEYTVAVLFSHSPLIPSAATKNGNTTTLPPVDSVLYNTNITLIWWLSSHISNAQYAVYQVMYLEAILYIPKRSCSEITRRQSDIVVWCNDVSFYTCLLFTSPCC